jgi:polynucleotide 5'-hydroxyl-kinase GRC3/NOL9
MIGRNGRSVTIYRRSGASRARVRVAGDRYSLGRRLYPLLKRGTEAESTSQYGDGGGEGRSSTSHVPGGLMLSAFQARKVRLAATSGVQEPAASSPTSTSLDPQSSAPDPTPKRSSRKRKPESVTGNDAEQTQRRKKTDDRKIEGKVRYFDVPVDVQELDLHSLTDEDISLSDQEILPQPHMRPQRAWSPSQPLLDSSDEEMETGAGGVQATNVSMTAPTAAPSSVEIDVNTFRLTPEECGALISIEEPAAAMILPVNSSTTLTGVYQLTVLQGAVMLMGVTLTSSNTSHAVFSPKLSPLPCIESLGNTDSASPLISHVPDRLRPWVSPDSAVILIRAHPTGIEGLGRVIRTFEGMFQSSQHGRAAIDLGIPGVHVHVVCATSSLSEQHKFIDAQVDARRTKHRAIRSSDGLGSGSF